MENELRDVLIKLSPTISGIKPAELLNLKLGSQLEECKNIINTYTKVEYLEIRRLKKVPRMQVLFYHRDLLVLTLNKRVNYNFLVKMGYPEEFNLERYLNKLIMKLKGSNFPHEVGVFLGYPLKDVLGYMGLLPLQLVAVKGWRYYGSEKLSRDYYEKIRNCREKFKQNLFKYL